MLPKNLLVTRKRKDRIVPKYLVDTKLAEILIQVFMEHEGRKYKELQARLQELEGLNFKVVRGLSTLLERKCEFQASSTVNSREVRTYLFERGLVTNSTERKKIIEDAAAHFKVSSDELEMLIFADLQEEMILSQFIAPSPKALIAEYNLALTQTLLFNALELSCKVEGNLQPIFRRLKFLGLMYEINGAVKITGPAALFKKTKRYGTALAKLLPEIMNAVKWEIAAKIELMHGGEPRIFNFELASSADVPFPAPALSDTQFDSAIESQFYREFKSLNTRWEIKREPELLKAGHSIMIPDFGFYLGNLRHFLEIVGFWTPEYLQTKLTKIRAAQVTLTVAVDKRLDCKKGDFPGEVIIYDKKVPLRPVLDILKTLEETLIQKELANLQEISISEDIISLQTKASELQIHPETLRRYQLPNHVIVGDQIISNHYLKKIDQELRPHQAYSDVETILDKYHVSMQVLNLLGYKILWDGLIPRKIIKITT